MTNTQISIKVPEGELKALLDRLEAARKEIYDCYLALGALESKTTEALVTGMMDEKAWAAMEFQLFGIMARECVKTGKTPDQTIAEMAEMPLAGMYEYLAVLKPLYVQELRELATRVDQVDIEGAQRNPAPDRGKKPV